MTMTIPEPDSLPAFAGGQFIATMHVPVPRGEEDLAVMPVGQLLQIVPDIKALEKTKTVLDPADADLLQLNEQIQRDFSGAKASNVAPFARYIARGFNNEDTSILPPITLYCPHPLQRCRLGHQVGLSIPYAAPIVPIDGGTQAQAIREAIRSGSMSRDVMVAVVLHHGQPLTWARQGFADLNTLRRTPTAAQSIGFDTRDFATTLAREIAQESRLELELQKRQISASSEAYMTISSLRQGVVTTLFGMAGLQYGTKPINDALGDRDRDLLRAGTLEVWSQALQLLEEPLARRAATVTATPVVLAAIGGVLNQAIRDKQPRRPEEVVALFENIIWDKEINGMFPWNGIAGKVTDRMNKVTGTTKQVFSVASPKELGYSAYTALADPLSPTGRIIRTRTAASIR